MDNQLSTGKINRDEHSSLVENIDKYYELQKKKLADKLSPEKPSVEGETSNIKQHESVEQQDVVTVTSGDKQTLTKENCPDESVSSNILEQTAKPVNMSDLLTKLIKTGLLPQQQPKENVIAPQSIAPTL